MVKEPTIRLVKSAHLRATLILPCLFGGLSTVGSAQELVPAAYTPAPVGVNLVTIAGVYSNGDVSFDPSLPVEDVRARIYAWSVGYARTFGFFGRAANFAVQLPYVAGDLEGLYIGEQTSVERSGLADAVLRFGFNLFGVPAMEPEEFAGYRPRTLLGGSLLVRAPTGEYDPSRLINIGANRWGFKPEIGLAHVAGKWVFDVYLGAWLFTENSDFYGGQTRVQESILSTQAHVRYVFGRGSWVALDGNFWHGGRSRVDGIANDDLQNNSRFGLTAAWQVAPRHGLRLAASRGAFTRIGGDFNSVGLSYSYNWM